MLRFAADVVRQCDLCDLGADTFEAVERSGRAARCGCSITSPEQCSAEALLSRGQHRGQPIGVREQMFDHSVRAELRQSIAGNPERTCLASPKHTERGCAEPRQHRDGRFFWHLIPDSPIHGQKMAWQGGREKLAVRDPNHNDRQVEVIGRRAIVVLIDTDGQGWYAPRDSNPEPSD
jgi:hypothetical protein